MRTGQFDYTDARIAVADLETGEHRTLMRGALARYSESGHLLVVGTDGALRAVPFDENDLAVGDPVILTRGVLFGSSGAFGAADFDLSADGTVVYVAGQQQGSRRTPVWVERNGLEREIDPNWEPAVYNSLALSPDDRRLAVTEGEAGDGQLRVKDLPDGPLIGLTTDSLRRNRRPVWSADGRTVTYIAYAEDTVAHRIRSDGSDVGVFEVLLDRDRPVWEIAYTPDETGVLFREGSAEAGQADLGYLDLVEDSIHEGLLASNFNERAVALSPDGRWMAYVSNVTGRDEVYVRPFPSVEASRTQVSRNGGREPVWGRSGQDLFYRDLSNGWLTVASYLADSTFLVQEQEGLFDASGYYVRPDWRAYDVTRNDQRFVFLRPVASERLDFSLILFRDFFTELKARVGR
jgi:serine/threonine-protein kinase